MFTPVFEITSIPADSLSAFVKDVTPTGGSTGYGSTNAPANLAAITVAFLDVVPYGEDAIRGVIASGYGVNDLGTAVKFDLAVPDGVVLFKLNYGELYEANITVSNDRLGLALANAAVVFEGVTHISLDGITAVEVESIASSLITLVSPLSGTETALTEIYRFYTSELRSLILRRADKCTVTEINKVASTYNSDPDTKKAILQIMLKESAEREYALGNYSKADEAARLICGTASAYAETCSTCG